MGSSSFHGTPCLVPAEFTLDGGESRRGFITRLSHVAAALSSDPELGVGTRLVVSFKRPADGKTIETPAGVHDHLNEGGLWRGRPAALIAFEAPVELEEGEGTEMFTPLPASSTLPPPPLLPNDSDPESYAEPPQRIGDDSTTKEQPSVGSFNSPPRSSGLGRRKLAGRLRRPTAFAPRGQAAPAGPSGPPPSSRPDHIANMEAAFFDDEVAPPPHPSVPIDDDDATSPPGPSVLDEFLSVAEPGVDFFGFESAPDVNPVSGENGDDEFMRRFGSGGDKYDLGIADKVVPSRHEKRFESEPGTLPPQFIAPASIPEVRVPEPPAMSLESTGERPPVGGAAHRQPQATGRPTTSPAPTAPATRPASDAPSRPPWEEDVDERAVASLMPRNARIASTVDVTFWARGRRNNAMADNFSREGLFLTYSGTPPVRGAIVRIEFPLEGSDESVPVRFNAEVRWHRSDRPGVGLADGFGVQILTFETPRDRARYAELLDAIMALGPASSPAEEFSWGRSGR